MVKSIIREHHWTPHYISEMYIDNTDINGIEYWYIDILEMHKQLNKK